MTSYLQERYHINQVFRDLEYDLENLGEPADLEIDKDASELQEYAEYGKGKNLRPITMRLDENLIRALKQIATRKGISYQALARMWLRESSIGSFVGCLT